ncbi:putative nuclease HARBI1 [Macrosteles quadrilineatus]|uniref:putative nuclease HARBI1 n=1 Tax=Macrosteles quadrilineatus TaxID=74068 RepID=UPI0023E324B5|nr:putative nuclease HARBI1 [Macrosteles quadrilineatus]
MDRPNARRRAYELAFESDSEEEYVVRRPRWIKERANDFDDLDEIDFVTGYRLSKRTTLSVLETIEDELEFPTDKNDCVAPINQLLCALRFYATGCYQSVSGDLSGFSTSTSHRIVHRVSCAIAAKRGDFVVFPKTQEEIKRAQLKFYDIARFPRVVGAIDCTHIRFGKCPDSANGEVFRNRKNYFSLNVQAVCNADLEITDIVVRWPGSTHDSYIFNNSRLKRMFEEGRYGNAVLVGDSGYACKNYMMTPLDVCNTQPEHLYNESQIRTRNPVERMFGVWKRRFPAMALGLRLSLENSVPVIVATAVLHNIAQQSREELPPDDQELVLPAPWETLIAEGNMGMPYVPAGGPQRENVNFLARQSLVTNHFTRLAQLAADY